MKRNKNLSGEKFLQLLTSLTDEENPHRRKEQEYLFAAAREVRENIYGKDVYVRGLIEFSNICRNNCYYCGIRKDNRKIQRYRLTPEEILYCAREGYSLGFRTFVLQGGEDRPFIEEHMEEIIRTIKKEFPDCAVTLSVGEWDRERYQCWREAGADRYLLRHETAVDEHYRRLHPPEMLAEKRKHCLYTLRELGYEVGAGMMIGRDGKWFFGNDMHSSWRVAAAFSESAASRDNSSGYDSAGRQGKRIIGGSKCRYAEPVSACGKGKICVI